MISAKIIADSLNIHTGVRIITWELEYPRIIHSEFMTHRVFSRNSASSRAIPIERMLETIRNNPAAPVHWGKNQAGMQAREELDIEERNAALQEWQDAMEDAIVHSENLHKIGAHKQIANRVTEPYQHMKVVMTTTNHNNWFWLRDHPDADPTIHALAKAMKVEFDKSKPVHLSHGQWHLPYVETVYDGFNQQYFYDENHNPISLEQAKMISASCCAQVSFRRSDGSLEKAEVIFKRLIESEPCHASPVEHQAMAFCNEEDPFNPENWLPGITHVDKSGMLHSGNFRGWVQFRQLIPNNTKEG